MSVKIESPEGVEALTEFVQFYDQVYAYREARWPADVEFHVPLLMGESPFAQGRKLRPFLARMEGRIVARVVAVVDDRYNRYWQERLGHLYLFEALPETREATKLLMDTACEWLATQGTEAARAGFGGLLDFPFVLDEEDVLPPHMARQNPRYYHRLFKDAGFESEKGWVDYKIEVRPELIQRWESALEAARRAGYDIVPLQEIPEARRVQEFTDTFNNAYKAHWGWTLPTVDEVALLLDAFTPLGILETSVVAYHAGTPVGMTFALPDLTGTALLKPGRVLQDCEKLGHFGLGVCESARGRGVNLAMAAYAYLEFVRRGARYLSYTLVVDDNWPSRRTAEKLGAGVCANYMVYRRNFRR
jgi:GNAT superfamily N-acetyltransferase